MDDRSANGSCGECVVLDNIYSAKNSEMAPGRKRDSVGGRDEATW